MLSVTIIIGSTTILSVWELYKENGIKKFSKYPLKVKELSIKNNT